MRSLVRTTLAVAAYTILAVVFSAPLFASGTGYEGTWNATSSSQDITELVIAGTTDGSGAMTVHAFKKCTPTPCDLGTVPLTGLNSVSSHGSAPPDAATGEATFKLSYAILRIAVSGLKSNALNDSITAQATYTFTDNPSHRAFFETDSLQKANLLITHPVPTFGPIKKAFPTPSPGMR